MRLGVVFTAIGLIVGALFGVMLAAYALGAVVEGFLLEKVGISGGSHIVQVVLMMLVVVMVIATLLTLAERKWSAFMQDRMGPNRARINLPVIRNMSLAGLPHIATDVLKMLTKEAFRPATANRFLFNLAPMLAFAPAFALFAIVPSGPTMNISLAGYSSRVVMSPTNPDGGLLFMFAIASLAVYGTSLAGWSSNNKFALLGGVRASSQMVSYEVALGLSLVGMMAAFSTVRLAGEDGMAAQQARYLWSGTIAGIDVGLPAWGIFLQPFGFLLFFAAAFAETKRAPFDTPEGESEIVGYFLEYSGMQFGLFMISEFVEVVVLSGVLTAIFFGGWSLPFGNQWLSNALKDWPLLLGALYGTVFWVKVVLLCYLQLAIRWTFPRFRYDQIQTLGWKILFPIGLANVFITCALILWDPSLKALALFGFLEIMVVVMLILTPPRQVRREQAAAGHAHGGRGHGSANHTGPYADHGHPAALSAGHSGH
jgi:NADH-quinone oxidoreductase subunit H